MTLSNWGGWFNIKDSDLGRNNLENEMDDFFLIEWGDGVIMAKK